MYALLWRFGSIKFGFISGIILGMVNGFIGISLWRKIYQTSIRKDILARFYYIQVFVVRIAFAIVVVIALSY